MKHILTIRYSNCTPKRKKIYIYTKAYLYMNIHVMKVKVLVAQSCPTLGDPLDCSLPGSSVHGTLQARVLEGVAMPSFRLYHTLIDVKLS